MNEAIRELAAAVVLMANVANLPVNSLECQAMQAAFKKEWPQYTREATARLSVEQVEPAIRGGELAKSGDIKKMQDMAGFFKIEIAGHIARLQEANC